MAGFRKLLFITCLLSLRHATAQDRNLTQVCAITLAGGQAAQYRCTAALYYDSVKNVTNFVLENGDTSSKGSKPLKISIALTLPGKPAVGIFSTAPGIDYGATIASPTGSTWVATFGKSTPAVGALTLTLTSIGAPGTTLNDAASGSVAAKLVDPKQESSPPITLSASFSSRFLPPSSPAKPLP